MEKLLSSSSIFTTAHSFVYMYNVHTHTLELLDCPESADSVYFRYICAEHLFFRTINSIQMRIFKTRSIEKYEAFCKYKWLVDF